MTKFNQIKGIDKMTTELEVKETKEEKRVVGTIIKLNQDKGYGFISSHDIKFTRIFFHWTSLLQTTKKFYDLQVKDKVEFTPLEVPDKGTRAIKIKVIADAPTTVTE